MFKLNKLAGCIIGATTLAVTSIAHAGIIIDNSTGGWYNDGIGDMSDYYSAPMFPGPNVSEGDPTNTTLPEPTTFGAAFGTDWLNGDYTGGSWSMVSDIPNSWAVNDETAIVYDFNLASTSDLHMDFGVDNGIYVWLNGDFLFGATAPGGASLSEYDLDIAGLGSGAHSLQILRADHGGGTGFQIQVDAVASPVSVPEPATLALLGLGLAGLGFSRRRAR